MTSVTEDCNTLEPNTTATINGKVFNISTMQCTYSSKGIQLGDPNNQELSFALPASEDTEVTKRYESETSDKIYSLQLTIATDSPPDDQTIDIGKYTPIIDTAAKSLKLQ